MKILKLSLIALLVFSQTSSIATVYAKPLVDGSVSGGDSGGSSGGGGGWTPPIDSGGDTSDPDPLPPSPPTPPTPSPPSTGDGDGEGDGDSDDGDDSDSGDSGGGGSTGGGSSNGEVGDATQDDGKSDSGGGVGKEKTQMDCTIVGDKITCDYDMYVEQNVVVNGTILQSVNNLNPAIHWAPSIEELPGLSERIISGFDPIPDKELILKDGKDGLAEYYEEIGDTSPNEVLIDEENNDYFYYADTIIDYQNIGNRFPQDSAKEIDAVYEGEYNLNKKMRGSSVPTGREFEILGGDALVYDDGYDFNKNRYVYKTMKDGNITKSQAINAIYKIFPETREYNVYPMQYELVLKDGQEDAKDSNGNKLVAVGNTPFVTTMPDTHFFINSKTYYTRTFVTRNLMDYYWEQAFLDGLVTLFEKDEVIKLSEFAKLVADMLYIQGEEVLNEEEQNLLVAIYGKDLPYYLDNEHLDAVKYLIARGIVGPDLNYDANLTTDDLLKILMRAVDENSRLDFKKIDIEYSEELVKKGFYPTNTIMNDPPMEDLQIKTEAATASHYDYFIKKIDWIESDTGKRNDVYTTFYQTDAEGFRRELNTLYVTQLFGYITTKPAEDTHYMGVTTIEGVEYYHFKIPVDIADQRYPIDENETGSPVENGYLNINTPGIRDVPMRWEVQEGGGIYDEPTGSGKDTIKLDAKPIPTDWSSQYTDKARKENAQSMNKRNTPLAPPKGTEVRFKTIQLDNILWKGKTLTKKLDDKDEDLIEDEDHPGYYTLIVPGIDVYKALMKDLSYSSNLITEHLTRAYVKDGKEALVSVTWLKRAGIINDVVEIDKGKKWVLYADNDNILIDIENKRIVSGQIVTEIMKSDASPLIVEDPLSKEILVDYRAVSSLTTDYLVIKDVNGNITMSADMLKTNKETTMGIYNLTGSGLSNIRVFPKNDKAGKPTDPHYISIEESYPVSNYIIYRSRKNNVRQDYLVVFKPAVDGMDPKANKHLKEITGINLADRSNSKNESIGTETSSSDIDVDIWLIGENKVITDDKDSKPRYTDKVLFNQERQKYYYDMPTVKDTDTMQKIFNDYMKKDGSEENPLPLVQRSDKILDMNINIMSLNEDAKTVEERLDFKDYPYVVQNKQLKTKVFGSDEKVKLGQMQLTVTGVIGLYLPYKAKSWENVVKSKGTVYIGSIPVNIKEVEHQTQTKYLSVIPVNNSSIEIASIEQGDYDKELFTEIYKGKTKSIFSYDLATRGNLVGFDDLSDSKIRDLIEGASTKTKATFDFLKAKFDFFLQNVDDSLTILILVLLYVVPRFLLFHFIAFMTLVLVSDSRLVQTLCYKVVDIYKIMSVGLTDVTRLNIKSVWISVFIGIVLMMTLVVAGNVIGLSEWVTQFVLSLMK